MKRSLRPGILFLLALGLVLALAACGQQPAAEQPEENAAQYTAFLADPGDCTPLTTDEIAWFNTEFFNNGYPCHTNRMARSLYNAPEEINLFETFADSAENWDFDEKAAVDAKIAPDDENNVFVKNSVATMNETLETYTGLTLDAMDGIGLKEMTYFEEYDAYYHYGYGATASEVQVFYGEWDGDGNVFLAYTWDNWSHPSGWLLHLTEQPDGSYHFVSNREPGLSFDGGAADLDEGVVQLAQSATYTVYDKLLPMDPQNDQSIYQEYTHDDDFDVDGWLAYTESLDFSMADTPVIDYRVTDIAFVREAEIDSHSIQIYRYSYALRPRADLDLTALPAHDEGGTPVMNPDGWFTYSPGANYLLAWTPEGAESTPDILLFTSRSEIVTDMQPEDPAFDVYLEALFSGRPDITSEDKIAELTLYYADDEKIIFAADSALCFYDLAAGKVDALMQFSSNESALRGFTINILRHDGTPMEVKISGWPEGFYWQLPELFTNEGKWFPKEQVRSADSDSYENVAPAGGDIEAYYARPIATLVETVPSGLVPQEGGVVSEVAIPFPDGSTGYLQSSDGTVGGISYVRSPQAAVTIFDGYFSASEE